jgi:hypothetical protein
MQAPELITAREFQRRAGGLSWEQLQQAIDWGLSTRHEGNRFDASEVPQVRRLYAMGAEIRSFPRRILRYRALDPDAKLSAATLRRAIRELLPAILTPGRKMKRMHAVRTWVDEGLHGTGLATWDPNRRLPADRWPAPPRKVWEQSLEGEPDDFFLSRLGVVYYHVVGLIPMRQQYGGYDISDIPIEEQAALLMVAEMAAWKERKRQVTNEQQ